LGEVVLVEVEDVEVEVEAEVELDSVRALGLASSPLRLITVSRMVELSDASLDSCLTRDPVKG
jgi:hypothetical protein